MLDRRRWGTPRQRPASAAAPSLGSCTAYSSCDQCASVQRSNPASHRQNLPFAIGHDPAEAKGITPVSEQNPRILRIEPRLMISTFYLSLYTQ